MKISLAIFAIAGFLSLESCRKSGSEDASEVEIANTLIGNPATILAKQVTALQELGAKFASLSEKDASALAGSSLSESDCATSGDLKARTADAASFQTGGLLRNTHPRFALGDFYCRIQKDSASVASLLGSLSEAKMLLCLAGNITYDNVERETTVSKDQLKACITHLAEAEQTALLALAPDGKTIAVKKAGFLPSSDKWSFGKKDSGWTGGVSFTLSLDTDPFVAQILLRNDDRALAVGVLQNGRTRKDKVDGFVTVLDKEKKSVFYEGAFQRIRSANSTAAEGWNRHLKFYGDIDFDKDSKISSLKSFQGIASLLSLNTSSTYASAATSAVQSGLLTTLKGSEGSGLLGKIYALTCSGASCSSANSKASWSETAGSNACNGTTSGTKCTGEAISLSSDQDLKFVMEASHASYVKAEDWFKDVKAETTNPVVF